MLEWFRYQRGGQCFDGFIDACNICSAFCTDFWIDCLV